MAACLVTIGGTSGSVELRWMQGSNPNSMVVHFGDTPYITDTATDVTYTTLTGDATASSGCLTITELESNCYLIAYEENMHNCGDLTKKIDNLNIGTDIPLDVPILGETGNTFWYIIEAVNTLELPDVKFVAYNGEFSTTDESLLTELILRVYGTNVPEFRIVSGNGAYSYIKGETAASCLPAGFIEIICPPTLSEV